MSSCAYPHPLDYVAGIKHCVTDLVVKHEFRVSPETFVVEELVDWEVLGLNPEKGEYAVIRVEKSGVDTLKAVSLLASVLEMPEENVLYYGLKDKNATTVSYFFVKTVLLREINFTLEKPGVRYIHIGYVKKKPHREAFKGNRFTVLLGELSNGDVEVLNRIISVAKEIGLLSYYGYQRFGTRRFNSHVLGKALLTNKLDVFADALLGPSPLEEASEWARRVCGDYSGLYYEERFVEKGLDGLPRRVVEIYLEAYSSYLFNLLLNKIFEEEGVSALNSYLPMPGCRENKVYEDIFEKEGLSSKAASKLPCYTRSGLFKPRDVELRRVGKGFELAFTLDPGFYATIVLREVFKENLVL